MNEAALHGARTARALARHHREAVLVFGAIGNTTLVRLVVRNVGGVSERLFTREPTVRRAVREET